MKTVVFKFFICFITGILAGILLGCTLMSVLVSYRIDSYHEKIVSLENVIEESEIKYKKLKDSLEDINKNKFIVKDIEVYLIYEEIEEDNFDKIEFEKYVRGEYKNVLGKEVNTIDMELIVEVVDRDVFILDGKQYRLGVDRMLLSETLKVWVTVKPI
ncbi:UNVERIFIED_CONTAM: hypothetical protein Cloal_2625 [Acetivibrio alkalicellulosi]